MKNLEIIDIHAHAFPDFLAEKAINKLEEHSGPYKAYTDGTINGLLKSMDEANITKSCIANIATKPEQINSIVEWCKNIKSERIIPLASFYPDNPNWMDDIDKIVNAGIIGIKLHPMYQEFTIDDKKMFPIYDYIQEKRIFILFHAGFDIAYPDDKRALPARIKNVKREFKNLKIVAAHFGGWQIWEDVIENLCGEDVYFDTSFGNEIIDKDEKILYTILNKHSSDRFIFGSDSPWQKQKDQVDFILDLKISEEFKEKIFCKNFNFMIQ
ncbi:MAG TPA: amidohydrolase family protein [Spirochaetota bacterium]|nr:amidohydrolase family protein [Spirochaetota bacterium]HOL56889.1 amidohydrolase family protein [Spirochaetota bacterium]HPP04471.1 amidohydrolase family protein [Spirochaetota bacterium]